MTAPEWRDVSALRVELESTSLMVDYHGAEILHRLDEAPVADVAELRQQLHDERLRTHRWRARANRLEARQGLPMSEGDAP